MKRGEERILAVSAVSREHLKARSKESMRVSWEDSASVLGKSSAGCVSRARQSTRWAIEVVRVGRRWSRRGVWSWPNEFQARATDER